MNNPSPETLHSIRNWVRQINIKSKVNFYSCWNGNIVKGYSIEEPKTRVYKLI